MNIRLLWEFHASIWLRPVAWLIAIFFLAVALLELDEALLVRGVDLTTPWLFIDSGEGARTILGALATATLTVAALAFSIIMLAVVQAANAYSPRVLREYLTDSSNQHVLGILLGTFFYTLIVLRRIEDSEEHIFLPTLSITVALALSLLSIIVFIYFVNHVGLSIQVNAIVKRIHEETAASVQTLFSPALERPSPEQASPALPTDRGLPVLAGRAGYIVAISDEQLVNLLTRADAVLRMEQRIGDYVFRHTPLATLWSSGADQGLSKRVAQTITIGSERTTFQDLHFGFQQLVDITLRGLSASINDPNTVVNCVNVLGALLVDLARYTPVSPYRLDPEGKLRLIIPGPDFSSCADVSLLPLHPYIASQPIPLLRLLEIYVELAQRVQGQTERETLWQHLRQMAFFADQQIASPWDRQAVNRCLSAAANALQRPLEGLLLEGSAGEGDHAAALENRKDTP